MGEREKYTQEHSYFVEQHAELNRKSDILNLMKPPPPPLPFSTFIFFKTTANSTGIYYIRYYSSFSDDDDDIAMILEVNKAKFVCFSREKIEIEIVCKNL